MTTQPPNDNSAEITGLRVDLAAFRGELGAEFKNLSHDVRNLTQQMQAQPVLYVPRREIEQMHTAMDKRVGSLEGNMNKAAWAIIMAWVAGLGVVATLVTKLAH